MGGASPIDDALRDHLRALELRLLEPALRASRVDLEALLAPEFREFASNGEVCDRQRIIDMLADEQPAERLLSDFRAVLIARDVALVTYRYRRTMLGGGAVHSPLRFSPLSGGSAQSGFSRGSHGRSRTSARASCSAA
jgi:hypothetical protein